MKTPAKVLLDTNVWIDAFDGNRKDRCAVANQLISACVTSNVELLYAAVSVKDVYYVLNASQKHAARQANEQGVLNDNDTRAIEEYAHACTRSMEEVATVVGMDASDLWLAHKLRRIHPDLEDDLVLAAAERAQADYLVTSDDALIRHATVAALRPKDLLALLEAKP